MVLSHLIPACDAEVALGHLFYITNRSIRRPRYVVRLDRLDLFFVEILIDLIRSDQIGSDQIRLFRIRLGDISLGQVKNYKPSCASSDFARIPAGIRLDQFSQRL